MNEFNYNFENPYFFIQNEIYNEILKINKGNISILTKVEFDNYNTFFPKNYLQFLNYLTLILLLGIAIYWILSIYKFYIFFKNIQKWFMGLLVLKLLTTIFLIKLLDLNYSMPKNQRDIIINEFLKIFFDTIISTLNSIFKSFFLFVFLLIFEVNYNN